MAWQLTGGPLPATEGRDGADTPTDKETKNGMGKRSGGGSRVRVGYEPDNRHISAIWLISGGVRGGIVGYRGGYPHIKYGGGDI